MEQEKRRVSFYYKHENEFRKNIDNIDLELLNKLDDDEFKKEFIKALRRYITRYLFGNINLEDIEIPFSSKFAKGKNYEDIVKMLKDAGFINISLSSLEDDAIIFTKTDKIEKITVDGKSTFDEGTIFKSNVKIIVYYYK